MSEYAPLGWTISDWWKKRAMMATGITDDDVRQMQIRVVKEVAEPEEDEDRTDAEPEEDEDREADLKKKKAKADDDQDDADEAEDRDRMDDMYVMRGYRRFR